MAAKAFLAHILAFHLAVPEPVAFRVDSGPVGFASYALRSEATIENMGGWWLIRYGRAPLSQSSPRRVRFVLAHETCHAVYDYSSKWGQITEAERRSRHARVNECARRAIMDHQREAALDRRAY
jgi:hypothetical protein